MTFRSLLGAGAALAALLTLAWPQPLFAQRADVRERRASGTAGVSLGDGESALALAAALRYEIAGPFHMEAQLAYARNLDFTLDLCPRPHVCVIGGTIPVTGRTVSLLADLVADLPSWGSLRPHLVAGGGVAHLRQRYVVPPEITRVAGDLEQVVGVPVERIERTRSKLAPALVVGLGADVPLSHRLAVGMDVHLLSIFDDAPTPERFIMPAATLTTVRLESRVSWRF
jgi:hypothetical protein